MRRRLFLRGLGGACVAAPFLSTLGGRAARAQAVAPPRRLIVMFTHYGCITTRFFPTNSNGPLTAADLEATTLKHLAPYADRILMPRGIRAMNEWTKDMVRGQGNDPSTQVVGSYFTCQPVTPNSNDPFSFDTASKFNAKPVGPSLDHVIAQQLSPTGTPLFMRVGNYNDSPQSGISYSAATTAYPGLGTPTQIFGTLTGLFRDGSAADTYATARGKNVLDLVKDDLDTLERFDMSEGDRHKLEAWKQLLTETTPGVTNAMCGGDTAASLGLTDENLAAASTTSLGSDVLTSKVGNTSYDGADMYSNLAALAAICNASPVIVLKYPGSYVFKGLGITTESHSLSARLGNAAMTGECMPGVLDMLLTIDDYYARKFAYLVGLLDGVTDGEAHLLDHSAAVWFNQWSDGCACNLNNLPIVQAGSMGGYFRTGCAVNVDDGSPTLTKGNSEVYCSGDGTGEADGLSQLSGTDPTLANAPINKYFCNLMNGLGVKAGPDGFPLKGGTEEVTHYGMYDRTEDFIGGGTKPPIITDPGEFTALRANS